MYNGRFVQTAIILGFGLYGMNKYIKTDPSLSMSFLLGGIFLAFMCDLFVSVHDKIAVWWYSYGLKP